MTFGTWLFTKMRGELVGTDAEGNRYFQDKKAPVGRRRKRWVLYKGEVEASRVPPDWHGWLHYTTDQVPPQGGLPRKPWQKDHLRNMSGSAQAYRPPGSTLATSGDKPKPSYEAWRPS
ncbi:MAG TPA: NADH:ubiquinone oxidoreductase subunit NDUFA12 [Reyranella sp.]|jgi:NADH:ubiquinone oxidoreductase subunit|nr:NADH:ubiquinone oxidoreductase subunit NDUFA12 [Reyranella sp.]